MSLACVVALAAASFAAGCVAAASSGGAPEPRCPRAGGGSHLVFTSRRDGDRDVYAASSDGVRRATLTRTAGDEVVWDVTTDGRVLLVRDVFRLDEAISLAVVAADGRSERRFLSDRGGTLVLCDTAIVISRFGATEKGEMYLIALRNGARRRLGPGYPVDASAGGRYLLFEMAPDAMGVYDLVGMTRRIVVIGDYDTFFGFAPNGSAFAYMTQKFDDDKGWVSAIFVVDAADPDGKPTRVATGEIHEATVAWQNDHTLTYRYSYSNGDGDVHAVDTRTGASRVLLPGMKGTNWAVSGNTVAFVRSVDDRNNEVVVSELGTQNERVIYRGAAIGGLGWSRNGALLAFQTGLDPDVGEWPRFVVVNRDGGVVLSVPALRRPDWTSTWSPDDATIALQSLNGLWVVTLAEKRVRRVMPGGVDDVAWANGNLSPRAPKIAAAPSVDVATGSDVRSRGRIAEIASHGMWVGALAGASRTDCRHAFGWRGGSRRVIRFRAPWPCDEDETWTALVLKGTMLSWSGFACGNYCYRGWYKANVRRGGSQVSSWSGEALGELHEGSAVPRPAPPAEVRRGVAISVDDGTIRLRRIADGRVRTLRPSTGAVDAELETAGLFYAYNLRGAAFPGRVVFVPFAKLFS